ncbi:MAG: hypothetical protein ACRBBR_00700 [Cellvibrionaceae bacterium]
MTNQVDTSQEAVDAEWSRIVNENEIKPETEAVEESGLNFDEHTGIQFNSPASSENVQNSDGSLDERIAMAEVVISGALMFAFDAIGGLDIPKEKYKSVSHAWAVVISKRFDGGIFEFMAKYKDELAAMGATLMFVGAVRASSKEKRKEAEAKKRDDAVKAKEKNGETFEHDTEGAKDEN